MSNFVFLAAEWPEVHEAAAKAEGLAYPDPRTACFYARRALELTVGWMYRHDTTLKLPYQDHLSALIYEPTFQQTVGSPVLAKAKLIKDFGNAAVHKTQPISDVQAVSTVRELFHVCFWLARTYSRNGRPPDGLAFDGAALPTGSPIPPQTLAQLKALAAELEQKDEKLSKLDAELNELRLQIAAAKAANAARYDAHDYSEAETRDAFVDLLLSEAGWRLTEPRDREYPVVGMPTAGGDGFVDYVLWGDDGRPLALVEAKRTKRSAQEGQQQARLYADCLEKRFGRRPIIFYSNGYEHWLWDDAFCPPRSVQGFLKKDELELMIQRRTSRLPLATGEIDASIVERHYQTRAIRRVSEELEKKVRKSLLVMATGAGKTRTVVALCDLLMRRGWVKRALFLADRIALVGQAKGVFTTQLPDVTTVNLLESAEQEGRVYVSTYATMMNLIDGSRPDGQRRFGVGHFDLVVVDEAHRSIFQKYRAIFEYFDAMLLGLTATPKDELDRNTYSLFELETGVPTDNYSLDEAVDDRYLVPPVAVSVPLKFPREGVKYDDLREDEKDQWDAAEWDEEGGEAPESVEAAAVNRWLFNKDTVDKVLEHLMERGQMVAGGDRLGKTIIFANNQLHAEFIERRFNEAYPHYKGGFARTITYRTEHAQSLIDTFKLKEKAPYIAISVDMLDTGIDIPEVVNLVFFKVVRSKTKFWQMLGRGTRLCPDLFGPSQDKELFYLFDYCGNLEYFNQELPASEGYAARSLTARLFTSRVELIGELDRRIPVAERAVAEAGVTYHEPDTEAELRRNVAELLRTRVAAMDGQTDFAVRPYRRLVEHFKEPTAWVSLRAEDVADLTRDVAPLRVAYEEEDELAKHFDLLMLSLQLALLRSDPDFEKLRDKARDVAGLLSEKSSIPTVKDQMELILALQSDEWWQDVTTPMLEAARRRLRGLVRLIERRKRKAVYTDLEDEMGDASTVVLRGVGRGGEFARFKSKAQLFLRGREDHLTLRKLKTNRALTQADLDELEAMLAEAGGTEAEIARAKAGGLGLFIRSLVGLDREAAKEAFAQFLVGGTESGDQIDFVNLIVDHLTEQGVMAPDRLWESPFTDIHDGGPNGLFTDSQVTAMVSVLKEIRARADSTAAM